MTEPLHLVAACWRRERLARELHALGYVERATAHVVAGWLPKVPAIDTKLALGRHLHEAANAARQLRRAVVAISNYLGHFDWRVPVAWRDEMRALDGAATADAMLAGLYLAIKPRQRERCDAILANTYRSLDHNVIELVAGIRARLDGEIAWARRLAGLTPPAAAPPTPTDVGPDDRVDAWLWSPLDRVPHAVRPDGWVKPVPGSAKLQGMDHEPETIGKVFHGAVSEEVTTMELFARSSYEHPDLPDDFHADMARQAADESRHASACLEVLDGLGIPFGTWEGRADSTFVYDYNYQYEGVEPGSQRELLWRLLTRSVFQEALSLDGFMVVIKKREFLGQEYLARILESLFADEIFHVQSGGRWSRYLCDGDRERMARESEAAHRHYVSTLTARRNRYCDEHPDLAIAELEHLEKARARDLTRFPFPLEVPVNRAARQAAGLDEREIEQIVSWGYARP